MTVGINERRRSPNIANLASKHNMLMSIDLLHSQNACVHCLVALIRFIGFICCSTTLPLKQRAVGAHFLHQ